jgi:plastocyanin
LLLALGTTSSWATLYRVGIGDGCDVGLSCFTPSQLSIAVGDSVEFFQYADTLFTGAHNVVADDGSFRCAKGCDGEGGAGTPGSDSVCNGAGYCLFNPQVNRLSFTRTFNAPGIVRYHDEVSGAAGLIAIQGAVSLAINAGISGAWFNPAQNGHGFMLEVLPGTPMRLLAAWLVFSPQGQSSWIWAVGSVNGNQAVLQGVQTVGSGAQFPPNFNAAKVTEQPWGTLTFTFIDCDHGHVEWAATAPGYGSGGMDLVRLTQPAGLTCP